MSDESTALEALDDEKVAATQWFKQFQGPDGRPRAAAALLGATKVTRVPETTLIEVSVTAGSGADAVVLANALCDTTVKREREASRAVSERKVKLLQRENAIYLIELEEDVRKQLVEKEQQLGTDAAGVSASFRTKEHLLEVTLREQSDAAADVAAARAEHDRLDEAAKKGVTPADVEVEAAAAPQVRELQTEFTRTRLAIAEAGDQPPPALARREAACRKLLAEATETARKQALAARTERTAARLADGTRRAELLHERVAMLGEELGRVSVNVSEYQVLLQRRQRLIDKENALRDQIEQINAFELQMPRGDLDMESRAVVAP